MATVAERIAALNAKKKEEPPVANVVRKGVKWQKPTAVETKGEAPVPLKQLSPIGLVSPQGAKPTPSWIKGNASGVVVPPKTYPLGKSTSPTTSPKGSPTSTPNIDVIPTLGSDKRGSQLGTPPKDIAPSTVVSPQERKDEPKVEIIKEEPNVVLEVTGSKKEELKAIESKIEESNLIESKEDPIILPKEDPKAEEPQFVEDVTVESTETLPVAVPVIETPPITEVVAEGNFVEDSTTREGEEIVIIVDDLPPPPPAPPVIPPSRTVAFDDKVVEEPDSAISDAGSVVAVQEEASRDTGSDISPSDEKPTKVLVKNAASESRRSVRFGQGDEVKVEEFDYAALQAGGEDPPTPTEVEDTTRARRRSSIGQKVVSILKRASRTSNKAKPEETQNVNGVSWG